MKKKCPWVRVNTHTHTYYHPVSIYIYIHSMYIYTHYIYTYYVYIYIYIYIIYICIIILLHIHTYIYIWRQYDNTGKIDFIYVYGALLLKCAFMHINPFCHPSLLSLQGGNIPVCSFNWAEMEAQTWFVQGPQVSFFECLFIRWPQRKWKYQPKLGEAVCNKYNCLWSSKK